MDDPRIDQLRTLIVDAGNPADGAAQQAYHKSPLRFLGIKADKLRQIMREVFPEQVYSRSEHLPVVGELWSSDCYDDRMAALWLLEHARRVLTPDDLEGLLAMTRTCTGWAELDALALRVLSPMALDFETAVFKPVRRWSGDDCMWTRRASILVHIVPAREQRLAAEYAWPTFEERLPETEVLIRKAIGWTLREISKHYPREVFGFLTRVGDRASALTRKEGARRLPDELRIPILGT